jgi:citrate synthase
MSKAGLDGVIAAETILSDPDGEAGRLTLRGHDLRDLAGKCDFETVTALLWRDFVPLADDAGALRAALGHARVAAYRRLAPLAGLNRDLSAVERMRFLLAAIPDGRRDAEPVDLLAAAAVAAALSIRLAQGQEPVAPDAAAGHAADLLRMIHGAPRSAAQAAALDAYLVTVADHGLNASTFTARVIASTAAGLPSAIVGALGALKGPLHGGAPGPVLDMLDEIGSADHAPAWMDDALRQGKLLMGFGHRVYRVRDPRADALKAALLPLQKAEHNGVNRLALAAAVEAAALAALAKYKPGRRLDVNVEFYTALLLDAVGIPRAGFTPIFAAARSAGWIAHVREQEALGRIIRPLSRYVGPSPAQAA